MKIKLRKRQRRTLKALNGTYIMGKPKNKWQERRQRVSIYSSCYKEE